MNEIINNLHLMRPQWLWAALPGLLIVILLWRQRGQSGSWTNVISAELLPFLVGEQQGVKQRNPLPILLCVWLLACLAAAGPSWQKIPQPVIQKQDALVMVLDLSLSMKAADLAPSRTARARQKLLDLLASRTEGQTGLIAYAGDAHIVTPLTDDNPTIANLLPALNPDMMPLAGSDAVAAVEQAKALLYSAGVRNGRVLLVTDEVPADQQAQIAETLANTDINLSVLGIGTTTGAPIPLIRGGFLKDSAGTIVVPGLNSRELQQLASSTGGRFRELTIDSSDLDYLLQESTLGGSGETLTLDRTADAWDDQGHWLVLLLLPFALVLFRRGWILCLAPLMFLGDPQAVQAQSWDSLWSTPDQQGQRALQAGDNKAAAQLFENRGWAGTASYRDEDYETAIEKFGDESSADSWYNRGNALAYNNKLDDAIAAYKESLALAPERPDALENIKLLEELKEQQEQQEQQQDENQDSEDQDQQEEQDQQDQDQQQGDPKQQDPKDGEQEPQEPQDSEAEDEQPEEEQEEQPEPEPEDGEPEEQSSEEQAAKEAEPSAEDQEKEQAMEQWLRRVPDDPSGLLREKFRYESQQRQSENTRNNDDRNW
ncbi:MAG: VWA domain-containing protein [Halioglobus sp.]